MVKTEIEKEIHRLILNDSSVVRTTKRTWHDGEWVDVDITYDLCGAIQLETGEHQILVEVLSYKPAKPLITWKEMDMFIVDDLKRHFEPLRNTNIVVWVTCAIANRREIMNHLRGDFLNMCSDCDLELSQTLCLLYRFMEEKVPDTYYGNMKTLFTYEGEGRTRGRLNTHGPREEALDKGDHKKLLALAREQYDRDKGNRPDGKAYALLKMAREYIELFEYMEAECSLKEAAKLMESMDTGFFLPFETKMELEYQLEMKRGNNELAMALLEKYVGACKKEYMKDPFKMSMMYDEVSQDAEYMGHKPLAQTYRNMGQIWMEKAKEEEERGPGELEWDEYKLNEPAPSSVDEAGGKNDEQ